MNPVFLDTSYLLALALSDDALHARAAQWQQRITRPLLTTEWVLVEFMDAMAEPSLRAKANQFVNVLRESKSVEIIPSTSALFEAGRALYAQRSDKSWGLTDCISLLIMQQRGLRDALTYDHHFEQAGFHALLREDAYDV